MIIPTCFYLFLFSKLHEELLSPGATVLMLNGMPLDAASIDVFSLLDRIADEARPLLSSNCYFIFVFRLLCVFFCYHQFHIHMLDSGNQCCLSKLLSWNLKMSL